MHISPGQREVQVIFCTDIPSQNAPPLSGAGLVQVRDRFCQPRPHRALQFDHSVHDDQPPLTAKHKHAWGCGRCAKRHQPTHLIRSFHSKAGKSQAEVGALLPISTQLHKGHGVREHKCLFWKSNMLTSPMTDIRVWEGDKSRHLNSHEIWFA